jgi:hypothetical protein
VDVARNVRLIDVDDTRADESDLDTRGEKSEAPLEPVGKGRVVSIHASHIPTVHLVEPAIERAREPELLVVAHHADTGIRERSESRRRGIRRSVIDDDELEVRDRLAQDALECGTDEWLAIVNSDENGDERCVDHYVP